MGNCYSRPNRRRLEYRLSNVASRSRLRLGHNEYSSTSSQITSFYYVNNEQDVVQDQDFTTNLKSLTENHTAASNTTESITVDMNKKDAAVTDSRKDQKNMLSDCYHSTQDTAHSGSKLVSVDTSNPEDLQQITTAPGSANFQCEEVKQNVFHGHTSLQAIEDISKQIFTDKSGVNNSDPEDKEELKIQSIESSEHKTKATTKQPRCKESEEISHPSCLHQSAIEKPQNKGYRYVEMYRQVSYCPLK